MLIDRELVLRKTSIVTAQQLSVCFGDSALTRNKEQQQILNLRFCQIRFIDFSGVNEKSADDIQMTLPGEISEGKRDNQMLNTRNDSTALSGISWMNYVHLDLSLNDIYTLEGLAMFTSLRVLDVSLNHISCIQNLLCLRQLRVLNLANNKIVYIDNLDGLSNLSTLDLSVNLLTSCVGLESLTSLIILKLHGNKITSLSGIVSLVALRELYIQANVVSDISPLVHLLSLRILDISNNSIMDLSEASRILRTMQSLKEIRSMGNPISNDTHYKHTIIENPSIEVLYHVKTGSYTMQRHLRRDLASDVDALISETSRKYVGCIEKEDQSHRMKLDLLDHRKQHVEKSFLNYQQRMNDELDQCVCYLQSLNDAEIGGTVNVDSLRDALKESQLERWEYEKEIEKGHEREEKKREQELVDSTPLLEKLRRIAEKDIKAWRTIKSREVQNRYTKVLENDILEQKRVAEFENEENTSSEAWNRKHDSAVTRTDNMVLNALTQLNPPSIVHESTSKYLKDISPQGLLRCVKAVVLIQAAYRSYHVRKKLLKMNPEYVALRNRMHGSQQTTQSPHRSESAVMKRNVLMNSTGTEDTQQAEVSKSSIDNVHIHEQSQGITSRSRNPTSSSKPKTCTIS